MRLRQKLGHINKSHHICLDRLSYVKKKKVKMSLKHILSNTQLKTPDAFVPVLWRPF